MIDIINPNNRCQSDMLLPSVQTSLVPNGLYNEILIAFKIYSAVIHRLCPVIMNQIHTMIKIR